MASEWHEIVHRTLKANEVRLVTYVPDNAAYQITGSQKTATAFKTDIPAMARGAGLVQSFWAADEAEFEDLVARALVEPGPWLITARIDAEPGVGTTDRDPAQIRDRFMRGLGVK